MPMLYCCVPAVATKNKERLPEQALKLTSEEDVLGQSVPQPPIPPTPQAVLPQQPTQLDGSGRENESVAARKVMERFGLREKDYSRVMTDAHLEEFTRYYGEHWRRLLGMNSIVSRDVNQKPKKRDSHFSQNGSHIFHRMEVQGHV